MAAERATILMRKEVERGIETSPANGLGIAGVERLRREAVAMFLSLKEQTEKGLGFQSFLVAPDSSFVSPVSKHLEGSD
jgi:hypothetical protein